jgi:hypothetical protein
VKAVGSLIDRVDRSAEGPADGRPPGGWRRLLDESARLGLWLPDLPLRLASTNPEGNGEEPDPLELAHALPAGLVQELRIDRQLEAFAPGASGTPEAAIEPALPAIPLGPAVSEAPVAIILRVKNGSGRFLAGGAASPHRIATAFLRKSDAADPADAPAGPREIRLHLLPERGIAPGETVEWPVAARTPSWPGIWRISAALVPAVGGDPAPANWRIVKSSPALSIRYVGPYRNGR